MESLNGCFTQHYQYCVCNNNWIAPCFSSNALISFEVECLFFYFDLPTCPNQPCPVNFYFLIVCEMARKVFVIKIHCLLDTSCTCIHVRERSIVKQFVWSSLITIYIIIQYMHCGRYWLLTHLLQHLNTWNWKSQDLEVFFLENV